MTPPLVYARQFTRSGSLLVAEASDLPAFAYRLVLMTDDHRQIAYRVDRIEHDREGDLTYWDLRPVDYPTPAGCLPIRIYND